MWKAGNFSMIRSEARTSPSPRLFNMVLDPHLGHRTFPQKGDKTQPKQERSNNISVCMWHDFIHTKL
jgi:hypothetical protein